MNKIEDEAKKRQKIRILWVGLALYLAILFNGFRYANRVPYLALVLGSIMNFAIVAMFIWALRNAYLKRKSSGE